MTAQYPQVQAELAKELSATLQARESLGAEYEPELVDSFVDKVLRLLDDRVEQRIGLASAEQQAAGHHPRHGVRGTGRGHGLAPMSLVLAIPLSAIAGGTAQLPGLLVAWAGIAAVNVLHAAGRFGRGARGDRGARYRADVSGWG